VVIAGDLYDRPISPAEAVKLFTDTLAQLARNGASVVALGEQFLRKVSCGCPLALRTEIDASDADWLFHAGGRLDGLPPCHDRYRQDPLPLRVEAPSSELFGAKQPNPPGLQMVEQGQLDVVPRGPLFQKESGTLNAKGARH